MPDSSTAAAPLLDSPWHARLALGFADDAGTTRLVERAHFGPLRVQKPLYPEGGAVCHAIIVHPPGGVVGGDQLAIRARVGPAAHAFLTTPGAAKWYKANGKVSRQSVRIDVAAGATLEWMPQESIFYDQARVELEQEITLAADANYIGCDILCLGRRASGETFRSGKISQCTQIRRGGKLLWWEQGALAGADAALHSALGLNGQTVCATLIAVGPLLPAALLDSLRALPLAAGAAFGVTQMKNVLLARFLGHDSEAARHAMLDVWRQLRPHLLGRVAQVPRIWTT